MAHVMRGNNNEERRALLFKIAFRSKVYLHKRKQVENWLFCSVNNNKIMDFDEDDLALSQDGRPRSSRGAGMRPMTSGGVRPSTANRPTSRRGSGVGSNETTSATVRPFSRQGSAMGGRPQGSSMGGRPIGSAMGGGRLGSAMHRSAVPGTASRLQGDFHKEYLLDQNFFRNRIHFFH